MLMRPPNQHAHPHIHSQSYDKPETLNYRLPSNNYSHHSSNHQSNPAINDGSSRPWSGHDGGIRKAAGGGDVAKKGEGCLSMLSTGLRWGWQMTSTGFSSCGYLCYSCSRVRLNNVISRREQWDPLYGTGGPSSWIIAPLDPLLLKFSLSLNWLIDQRWINLVDESICHLLLSWAVIVFILVHETHTSVPNAFCLCCFVVNHWVQY